ncbi:MAG: hypothetical protein HKN08_05270 [Gammaproteobacteria bacterium]|nr:hypothetical protein [Gammaproteobacteria bacterium]
MLNGYSLLNKFSGLLVLFGVLASPVYGQSGEYPAPSHPEMTAPQSAEDIMPYAREFAANENGFLGHGFGIAQAGESIILVATSIEKEAEIYFEAIIRALEERGVNPIFMRDHDIVGVSLEEARELAAYKVSIGITSDSSTGWSEGCNHFKLNDFLETTRPDLYEKCNPPALSARLPDHLQAINAKLATARNEVPRYVNEYIDNNPKIKGVFYGRGGPIWERFAPKKERWLGLFRFDNMWIAMSPRSDFPADVWMLSEEISMEPMASTDKVTITDPEGTDAWFDLTEDQAQRWAAGVYLRGHLFIFPQEAYGGYGLNVLNYPANIPDYIPASPIARLNGTVVAHASHAGFFPAIEQVWDNGYLKEVKGGGLYGELLRTLMKMPGMNEKTWPHYPEPGYFWHYESALGTNPKGLRPDITKGRVAAERERDGIIHWALGAQVWHDPGDLTIPAPSLVKFEEENKLPGTYHGFHLHNYFNTVKLRIRGTDRWVTIVEKGRSNSLDNPEVRALASRYGDPDEVLSTEWVPEIPGINAPGNFEKFAEDPYTHDKGIIEQIKAGTYNKFNPYVRPPNN